ncbi:MAG TPA: hypothetical protein VI790_04635 [Candidatus Nanoarchaeia archaeon]|nr:hypothetical protein [Candidatus Nanoarchaeia archaeon]
MFVLTDKKFACCTIFNSTIISNNICLTKQIADSWLKIKSDDYSINAIITKLYS